MKAVIISDLHLEESRGDIAEAFFSFCQKKLNDVDHFFILGDFFEVWIGDDYEDEFITSIKNQLKEISSKVKNCFFQHGNRDFLIGEKFCKEVGFKLLPEHYNFNYLGKDYLLIHGDSLCTKDVEYMQARLLLRSEQFKNDVLGKSIEERKALARQLRMASMDASSGKSMEIMDVTPEEVVKLMEVGKVDVLIHGHTHRPARHKIQLSEGKQVERIVTSDWEKEIQYVEISEQGPVLITF
jgi:UDP-2,3-diacylglucosamine hydrolase